MSKARAWLSRSLLSSASRTKRLLTTTTKEGYQSIGSFHSENVEHLLELSDADYRPPELPFDVDGSNAMAPSDNGDFLLDRTKWTFLNHGAFGAALRCGHVRAQQWRDHLEHQPLRYFDRDLLPHLVYSTRRLAAFAYARTCSGMILSQNATTLLNAVIAGYVRTCERPVIVLWDTTYGSVKKMAQCYGARVVEVPFQEEYLSRLITSDTPQQVFQDALDETLAQNRISNQGSMMNNALLILDQTTSNTALNVSIESLAKHAKERYGMLVLVDGAHGLLAQDVSLQDMADDVDFYISNGHKWLSCPRGVAMLHCGNDELRNSVLRQPVVVSHGIDDGYFSRFIWDGTRDYAAELALPVVLDYWARQGPVKVRATLRSKLIEAIAMLADLWHNVSTIESLPGHVTIAPVALLSPMALVRLPEPVCGHATRNPKTSTDAKRIQDYLYDNWIEAPIKNINGILYVRISCHVYNDLHEYERLGQVMLSLS